MNIDPASSLRIIFIQNILKYCFKIRGREKHYQEHENLQSHSPHIRSDSVHLLHDFVMPKIKQAKNREKFRGAKEPIAYRLRLWDKSHQRQL